jgi:hypothetical protein
MTGWESLDLAAMHAIKVRVAIAGALLLGIGAVLTWRRREDVLRRTRDALLAALGVLSICCYFNLFRFHFDDYLHLWDIFHYYIGAKYLPELGYTRLYECAVVAERDLDGRVAESRRIRDLVTNDQVPVGPILADPTRCTAHFTPERWREFVADIGYFRSTFTRERWQNEVLADHGYNGTPVWAALGRALASLGPATHGQLTVLALIDPFLMLVMWSTIAWAFGWRTACVGLLFWGTNYPAQFYWNGGAFLRTDWLALAMIGICLVKKGRPALGGAALTYSALLRVFPGFILVALLAKHVVAWVRARRVTVSRELARFVLGCAAAGAILVPVSLALAPGHLGLDALGEFIANSKKHLDTPLTNNMGLKTVVSYQPSTRVVAALDRAGTDPYGRWKEARRRIFAERRPIFLALLAGFLVLLAWAAAPEPDWAALTLGVGLIPFAAELTCYYFSFLLAYAFLWPRRPIIGVGLCVLAGATSLMPRIAWWEDAQYFNISLWVLGFIIAATIAHRLRRASR